MNFDDQKRQPGIEALAGSIRLKARLLAAITGFDGQISLGRSISRMRLITLDDSKLQRPKG
jgi:hypothetical protein